MANEQAIRLGFFLGIFALVAVWEVLAPRRKEPSLRGTRWTNNIGIVVLNTVMIRLLFPASAVGLALVEGQQGWGILNLMSLPFLATVISSIILLDLALYLQHVLFHAVPILWRVHRMHHADTFFDITTGVRFHPIEILLSLLIKLMVVAALGPPAVAVLIFEVVLNATSMFNHGNVWMKKELDGYLRWFVVTPDMHRVHHSRVVHETNSNFGFNLPWWDRLFGTYRSQPANGHDGMTIGLDQFRGPSDLRLDRMLLQPFRGGIGEYAINQRKKNP